METLDGALRFTDKGTAARHGRLRDAAAAIGAGWRHAPATRAGSTVTETWWTHAPDLPALLRAREVGSRWVVLGTCTYADRFPEVFGLTWRAGHLDAALPAELALSLRGGRVCGSHFSLTFPVRGDEPAVVIADRRDLRLHDAVATWTLPTFDDDDEGRGLAVEDAIERLLASPSSFRAAVLEWDDAARTVASRLLDEGRAWRGVVDPTKSVRGIPPPPLVVPLTSDEVAEARSANDRSRAKVFDRVEREHGRMFEALHALLPAEAWSSTT